MKDQVSPVENSICDKLSRIRKELKCWESLFFRSHGRKPNREDIEVSGNEIKGAYKEYYSLKGKLNLQGNEERDKTPSDKESVDAEKRIPEDNTGIFGRDLNRTADSKKQTSHLKYHSVREKHQTTFVKKRHLKSPAAVFKVKSNNDSGTSENNELLEKEKNNDGVSETVGAVNNEEKLEIESNDLKENKLTENIQITSKQFGPSHSGRKSSFGTGKFCPARRNYHVSKAWLEKVKPNDKSEEELEPFEEFEQKMDTEFDSFEDLDEGNCRLLVAQKGETSKNSSDDVSRSDPPKEFNCGAANDRKSIGSGDGLESMELDTKTINDGTISTPLVSDKRKDRSSDPTDAVDSAVKNNTDRLEEELPTSHANGNLKADFNMNSKSMGHVKNAKSSLSKESEQEHFSDDKMTVGSDKVTRKRKAVDESDVAGAAGKEVSGLKEKRQKTEASNAGVPRTSKGNRLVSENFVKIDIQKKKFCRGKRRINASTYKRQMFKKKTQFNTKSTAVCFKCHKEGHWSKECGKRSTKGNPSRYSSFNGKTKEDYTPVHESDELETRATFSIAAVPDLPRCWPRMPYHPPRVAPPVPPLYEPVNGQPSQEAFKEVNNALKVMGYSSFRQGQEATVARIVSGLSTLLVLSTGSGKSLCYQLPAYLFYKKSKSLTIVISPLVALMEDQVSNLPHGLKGACYNANMSKAQKDKVLKDIEEQKIAILLLSPEALVSGSSSEGYTTLLGSLPHVAFACIDEAHCVSEWSHNFRPNYLRVCKVVRDYLGINCFLGLTATSTKSTARSIAKHIGIELVELDAGIIRGPTMPDNLHITISKDFDRDRALVGLLSGERFSKCTSIIIYCTRREQTERLSSLLRTCLQALPPTDLDVESEDEIQPKAKTKKKGRSAKPKLRSVSWDAECYHAGLSPAQRRKVQKKFMSGELRIVVATVAFGMGLDKSNVRAIIHYNMPKSFESFLQEIGRAGRDGLPAHCHIFLDEEAKDLCELRRHTYANSVDGNSLKKLVKRAFRRCDCEKRYKEALKGKAEEPETGAGNGDSREAAGCASETAQEDRLNRDQVALTEDFIENCFDDDLEIDAVCQEDKSGDSKREDVPALQKSEVTYTAHTLDGESDCTSTLSKSDGKLEDSVESYITVDPPTVVDNQSNTIRDQIIDRCDTPADQCDGNDQLKRQRICSGHHVTFSVQETVLALDIPEENIATLLSYLEFLREPPLTLLNPIKASCTVQCYGGAKQMQFLAMKFLPVTAVFNNMRRNRLKLADSKAVTFNVVDVADEMGWDLEPIYRELRSVQWNTSFSLSHNDSLVGKSGVLVEFDDPSFHVIAPGDLSDDERDFVCSILLRTVKEQEETRLLQLDALYNILDRSCNQSFYDVIERHNPQADKQLRESIREYFECEPSEMKSLLKRLSPMRIEIEVPQSKWDAIARDVRTLLCTNDDVTFTGRALARIFHGIDSPCFPAIVWGRNRRVWRQYIDVDFNDLRKFVTDEIIKYRT